MSFKTLSALVVLGGSLGLGGYFVLSTAATGVLSTKAVTTATAPAAANATPTVSKKKVSVVTPDPARTVYIVGEIGYNALEIAAQITRLGQEDKVKPIYVVETSPGGSVLTGGQIIAAIEASPAPVYTICHVLCASMAAMIFEYGDKRFIGDRSFLMFHPASGGADGELDKMISRLVSMQRYIGKMEAYAGNKANLTFEQYKSRSQVEAWIDGEDAVASGFADEIATVSLPKNSPFDGLFGAKALYDAIYHRQDPFITVTPGVYSTNPADFQWVVSPKDLKWLSP